MRNLLIALAFIIFTGYQAEAQAQAQVSYGVEAGVSPAISGNTDHVFVNRDNPREEFAFNLEGSGSSIFFGGFVQIELDQSFFMRAKALFNRSETNYKTISTWGEKGRSLNESYFSEKVTQLDLPVTLGVNLGMFEINSGLVTRINLKNSNEMTAIEGFKNNMKAVDFAWQTGVGLNISNIRLGVTYEMDFKNYGSHLSVNDHSLGLLNSPARIKASIGYRF